MDILTSGRRNLIDVFIERDLLFWLLGRECAAEGEREKRLWCPWSEMLVAPSRVAVAEV